MQLVGDSNSLPSHYYRCYRFRPQFPLGCIHFSLSSHFKLSPSFTWATTTASEEPPLPCSPPHLRPIFHIVQDGFFQNTCNSDPFHFWLKLLSIFSLFYHKNQHPHHDPQSSHCSPTVHFCLLPTFPPHWPPPRSVPPLDLCPRQPFIQECLGPF